MRIINAPEQFSGVLQGGGTSGSIGPSGQTALNLVLDVPGDTYPPELSASLNMTYQEDDVLRLQSSADENFTVLIIDSTQVLDAAAILAGSVTFSGLDSIVSPTETFFRVIPSRGAATGEASNIVKHGDVTAPTITSSASPSGAERAPMAHTLTANETVTWAITGGADSTAVELTDNVVGLVGGADLDFETKASYAFTVTATDLAGNTTDQAITFTVVDIDEVPDTPVFTAVTDATVSTQYESIDQTIAGLASGVDIPITVTGGEYRKNGGSWTTAAGTVVNGDIIRLRGDSSADFVTLTAVTLDIGVVSADFNITTMADPSAASFAISSTPAAAADISFGSASYTSNHNFDAGEALIAIYSSDRRVSGVTRNGVAATLVQQSRTDDNGNHTSLWQAPDEPAGNYDVVATGPSTFRHIGVKCGTLVTGNTTPSDTANKTPGYTNNPQVTDDTLVVPAGGVGIAVGTQAFETTFTWANGTEVSEDSSATAVVTIGFSVYGPGTVTPEFDGSAYKFTALVAGAWSNS